MRILHEVKGYIRERELVSAREIADHFDTGVGTVRQWMVWLIQQGQIQQIEGGVCTSGTCGGCAAAGEGATLYRWLPRRFQPLNVTVRVTAP